jgi:hypothetical protein
MWRVDAGIIVGLLLMGIYLLTRPAGQRPKLDAKYSAWMWIWLVGLNLLTLFGAFSGWQGAKPIQLESWYHPLSWLKFPWDTIWVVIFGLIMYFVADRTGLPAAKLRAYVEADAVEVEIEEREVAV